MKTAAILILFLMLATALSVDSSDDTRLVFHVQGFVSPAQEFYFHLFQFTDPASTSGTLGYARPIDLPGGSALGLLWLSADDDANAWTGLGFWPSWNLTDRLTLDIDSRFMVGWGNTPSEISLVPWLQYRLDTRNSVRLQAGGTEAINGDSPPWLIGPFWIYHIDESTQFRLGYQNTLSGDPDPRIILGYVVNL